MARPTQDSTWTDIRCPFEKRRDASVVFWDNVVYILGGSQLFPIKRMDCYNVLKDSWYSRLGPPTPRDSLAACASEGKIYTSGGSEVGESWGGGCGGPLLELEPSPPASLQAAPPWTCLNATTPGRSRGR